MNTLERVEGSLSLGDSEERSREPSKVTRSARLVLPRSCSSGSEKDDFFSPFEARISVSFDSFRLIFGREIISRRVLEE